jgi:hypothetical protein
LSRRALKTDERSRESGHFGGHRAESENLIAGALNVIRAREVREGAPNHSSASSGLENSEGLVNVIRVLSVSGYSFRYLFRFLKL